MEQIKEKFSCKDNNGNDLDLVVVYPNHKIIQDANLQYNYKMSFLIRQAMKSDERLLMRSELESHLNKLGIWTKEDSLTMEKAATRIRACELMIRKGGLKKSEGRQIAIEMSELRNEMLRLYNKRQQFDSITAESTSENHRFNFLASKCILIESSNEPYFKDLQDYIEKSSESIAISGASILAKMLYGIDGDAKSNLFEIQWLKRAGYIDDAGRYINDSGELTDRDGRRINGDCRYINEDGKLIDKNGNLVDEKGDFFVEISKPFIDDETGEPIEI
jgi:hypothetical protein